MKLPRNARIFQGQLDVAPFAGVFFLLLMFIMFGSALVYTPGIQIELPNLPQAWPGTTNPTVMVAIAADGSFYYQRQLKTEEQLFPALVEKVKSAAGQPITLIVAADKSATADAIVTIMHLGRVAGFQDVHWAMRTAEMIPATNSTSP